MVEHEYRRGGTLAYLAAMDVHDPARGLCGHVEAKISNRAFDALVDQVMSTEPYASARVLGRRQRHHPPRPEGHRPARRALAEPRLGPPADSRVLAEPDRIYFSILARKALIACHFASLDWLADRALGFQEHYRQAAKPFPWTFTRTDLHRLMAGLQHDGRLAPAA